MPMYANIYKQAMKDRAPELYRSLKASGRLEREAERAEDEVLQQIQDAYLDNRAKGNDLPFMEKLQFLNNVRKTAEEIALAQITEFPQDDPPEPPDDAQEPKRKPFGPRYLEMLRERRQEGRLPQKRRRKPEGGST